MEVKGTVESRSLWLGIAITGGGVSGGAEGEMLRQYLGIPAKKRGNECTREYACPLPYEGKRSSEELRGRETGGPQVRILFSNLKEKKKKGIKLGQRRPLPSERE